MEQPNSLPLPNSSTTSHCKLAEGSLDLLSRLYSGNFSPIVQIVSSRHYPVSGHIRLSLFDGRELYPNCLVTSDLVQQLYQQGKLCKFSIVRIDGLTVSKTSALATTTGTVPECSSPIQDNNNSLLDDRPVLFIDKLTILKPGSEVNRRIVAGENILVTLNEEDSEVPKSQIKFECRGIPLNNSLVNPVKPIPNNVKRKLPFGNDDQVDFEVDDEDDDEILEWSLQSQLQHPQENPKKTRITQISPVSQSCQSNQTSANTIQLNVTDVDSTRTTFNLLSFRELCHSRQWIICGKVRSKSDIKRFSSGLGTLFSFVLADQSGDGNTNGDSITCKAFNAQCQRLYHRIEVGQCYFICRATVRLDQYSLNSVKPFEIVINENSLVIQVDQQTKMVDSNNNLNDNNPSSSINSKVNDNANVGAQTQPKVSVNSTINDNANVGIQTQPKVLFNSTVGIQTQPRVSFNSTVGIQTQPRVSFNSTVGIQTQPRVSFNSNVGIPSQPRASFNSNVGIPSQPRVSFNSNVGIQTQPRVSFNSNVGAQTQPRASFNSNVGISTQPKVLFSSNVGIPSQPRVSFNSNTGIQTQPRALFSSNFGIQTQPRTLFNSNVGIPSQPRASFNSNVGIPSQPRVSFNSNVGIQTQPKVLFNSNAGIQTQPRVLFSSNVGIPSQPRVSFNSNVGIQTQPKVLFNSNAGIQTQPRVLFSSNVGIPSQPRASFNSNVGIPSQPRVLSNSNVGIPSQPKVLFSSNVGIPSQPKVLFSSNVGIPSQPKVLFSSNVGIPSQPRASFNSNVGIQTQPKVLFSSNVGIPSQPRVSFNSNVGAQTQPRASFNSNVGIPSQPRVSFNSNVGAQTQPRASFNSNVGIQTQSKASFNSNTGIQTQPKVLFSSNVGIPSQPKVLPNSSIKDYFYVRIQTRPNVSGNSSTKDINTNVGPQTKPRVSFNSNVGVQTQSNVLSNLLTSQTTNNANVGAQTQTKVLFNSNAGIQTQPRTLFNSNVGIPSQPRASFISNVGIPSQPRASFISNVGPQTQPNVSFNSNVGVQTQPNALFNLANNVGKVGISSQSFRIPVFGSLYSTQTNQPKRAKVIETQSKPAVSSRQSTSSFVVQSQPSSRIDPSSLQKRVSFQQPNSMVHSGPSTIWSTIRSFDLLSDLIPLSVQYHRQLQHYGTPTGSSVGADLNILAVVRNVGLNRYHHQHAGPCRTSSSCSICQTSPSKQRVQCTKQQIWLVDRSRVEVLLELDSSGTSNRWFSVVKGGQVLALHRVRFNFKNMTLAIDSDTVAAIDPEALSPAVSQLKCWYQRFQRSSTIRPLYKLALPPTPPTVNIMQSCQINQLGNQRQPDGFYWICGTIISINQPMDHFAKSCSPEQCVQQSGTKSATNFYAGSRMLSSTREVVVPNGPLPVVTHCCSICGNPVGRLNLTLVCSDSTGSVLVSIHRSVEPLFGERQSVEQLYQLYRHNPVSYSRACNRILFHRFMFCLIPDQCGEPQNYQNEERAPVGQARFCAIKCIPLDPVDRSLQLISIIDSLHS